MENKEIFEKRERIVCPECTCFEAGVVETHQWNPLGEEAGLVVRCEHGQSLYNIIGQHKKWLSNHMRYLPEDQVPSQESYENWLIEALRAPIAKPLFAYVKMDLTVICLYCQQEMVRALDYEEDEKLEYGFTCEHNTCPARKQRFVVDIVVPFQIDSG